MKKNQIILIIVILLLLLVGYKTIILYKYHCEIRDIDTTMIFNETLTINSDTNYSGKHLTIDNMSIANYFEDYSDTKEESSFKVKYDKDNKVASFYSMSSFIQYVNILNTKSLEMGTDSENSLNGYATTDDSTRKYLNSHNIKNDIDLLNYIKKGYYFKNNLFTCTNTMKNHYLLNSFVNVTLVDYQNIVLIKGKIDGYMINVNSAANVIKEIHILKDDQQYIILLGGSEITSNEFITKLLSTITFN